MAELAYTEAELMSDLPVARPHVVAGRRMHGGFDADGRYIPPRAAGRERAIADWTHALRQRGGELFAADASLLTGPRMPNLEQQRLLLREGIGVPFWNNLTTTGKIEGRGRILAEMQFPDLAQIVAEDVSTMAIGHLGKGLLKAHGIDEGGEPARGIGGHDVMWFVARDLVFGADAYPDVEPPESISRPEAGRRWMPELPAPYEGLLSFLMNLLMIEFRAEIGFASTQAILRTPDLFADRREAAEEAAEIVERIREDERIHVTSLRLYLGELRACRLRTVDGGTVSGAEVIDRFWSGLVNWATVEQPRLAAEQQRLALEPLFDRHPEGARIRAAFDACSDLGPARLAQAAVG
ncbi:MAG TPA: hypothetical protein DCR65_04155 [Gammaproteobacteria bacterium]|jgi:hypothetical protein|nr:hypothetical protein [Gammaproteobacteria bacterium]